MLLGTVTGSVWATKKSDALVGLTFLEVTDGASKLIAADLVGAGLGDRVLVTTGSGARAGAPHRPCDAAIVAILDEKAHSS